MSEPEASTWYKVDLHIHAGALAGEEGENSLLAILRRADAAALDMIGVVDHSSVRGYEQLRLETGRLTVLREAGRLQPEQEAVLGEYERLLGRIVLLPGFEIVSQEGVGLVALFSPETSAERLNALLLNLGIPMERLREAAAGIRAPADLATAALLIAQAGGVVIASYGDVDRNGIGLAALPLQVHALEVAAAGESPAALPRPAVWSSAAGCLRQSHDSSGIGASYTEIHLPERSFAGLHGALLAGAEDLVRFPVRERLSAYVAQLRQEGPDQLILYGPAVDPLQLYRDVAALANGGGGILIIGLTEEDAAGVANPESWSVVLTRAVREQVDPPPHLNLELLRYGDKELIRIEVHAEAAPPYLTAEGIVYVHREGRTRPAERQEVLDLVTAGMPNCALPASGLDLPQAGVEIVGACLRDGVWFYDVRDLRVTSGVTRQRAKGLWAYAIERQEKLRLGRADLAHVGWKGDRGVWRAYTSGERRVFDLLHRDPAGRIDHIFYGVSEWGLTPRWRDLVESVHPVLEEAEPPSGEEGEPTPGDAARGGPRPVGRPSPRPAVRERPAPAPVPVPTPEPAVGGAPPLEPTLPEEPSAVEPPPAVVESSPPPAPEPEPAAQPEPQLSPGPEPPAPAVGPAPQSSPGEPGRHLPRWRGQAAVERVYWEGLQLFFDLVMRQENDQVRSYRHIHRNQLAESEGWVDLVRVALPATGVEIVRCTASGDEFLYQFRDPQSGRVDPRVRRQTDFSPDSPYTYAIQMHEQDTPLDEARVYWWGNIGYLRADAQRTDLVYRDEEGRDHIYYAAERALLEGEWQEMLGLLGLK